MNPPESHLCVELPSERPEWADPALKDTAIESDDLGRLECRVRRELQLGCGRAGSGKNYQPRENTEEMLGFHKCQPGIKMDRDQAVQQPR